MLKAAFWSPAEPTWDFKVCAAPRSNAHFAGGGWLPTDRCPFGDHPEPANDASCSAPISGRAQNASCFSFSERSLFWFSEGQGRSPRGVQEGSLPPIHPRIPPKIHKRICSVIDSAKAAYIDDVGCL